MSRLGRVRRNKYEGRTEKRGGTARTDETRKWNEGSNSEVKGMETLTTSCRSDLSKIKPTDPFA